MSLGPIHPNRRFSEEYAIMVTSTGLLPLMRDDGGGKCSSVKRGRPHVNDSGGDRGVGTSPPMPPLSPASPSPSIGWEYRVMGRGGSLTGLSYARLKRPEGPLREEPVSAMMAPDWETSYMRLSTLAGLSPDRRLRALRGMMVELVPENFPEEEPPPSLCHGKLQLW